MDEPWDSAGKRVQLLARRQEVQELWPRLASVLEALGQSLVDACHDMEQLSADGPLQQAPDFHIAFERRVMAALAEATGRSPGGLGTRPPTGGPEESRSRSGASGFPRASALP
jgi:hypothetical protein